MTDQVSVEGVMSIREHHERGCHAGCFGDCPDKMRKCRCNCDECKGSIKMEQPMPKAPKVECIKCGSKKDLFYIAYGTVKEYHCKECRKKEVDEKLAKAKAERLARGGTV